MWLFSAKSKAIKARIPIKDKDFAHFASMSRKAEDARCHTSQRSLLRFVMKASALRGRFRKVLIPISSIDSITHEQKDRKPKGCG